MATGAGGQPGLAGTAEQRSGIDALPVPEAGAAWDQVSRVGERAAMLMLPVIEVSDKDYRSFCFPCHALEEAGDRNDAV